MSLPLPSPQLSLPDVTLVCVDTRSPTHALDALRRCMAAVQFGRVVFFGNQEAGPQGLDWRGIDWVGIEPLRGIGAYSRFVLHELVPHVHTSHCLVVQWDGFVLAPASWRDEFLQFDYIGAPWFRKGRIHSMGNGGFSLRSKKLLQALSTMPLDGDQPEDRLICVDWRRELEAGHGICFAPLEVAARFSVEEGPWRECFGFHGVEHFGRVMSEAELAQWWSQAPRELVAHPHTRKLVKALMRGGRWRQAMQVNARHAALAGWNADRRWLQMRAWFSRFRSVKCQGL